MTAAAVDIDNHVRGVLSADRAALGRAITLVESTRADHGKAAQELLRRLLPHSGNAHRVGISGVPGVGKSTFIDAMGALLTARGHRVAVLAVDPSSTRSGGSILGDRTRMLQLSASPNAFVRPSPSSGTLGGVARATRETVLLVEAAGFDVVLVETVGVGQSEVAVAGMVDTFLMLGLARAGDSLQGIKRGVLELVDVVGINKADGDHRVEAERAARELERALRMLQTAEDGDAWRPKVRACSGQTGEGLEELWALVERHREVEQVRGTFDERRAQQGVEWMWSQVTAQLLDRLRSSAKVRTVSRDLEESVRRGDMTASTAASEVLDTLDRG